MIVPTPYLVAGKETSRGEILEISSPWLECPPGSIYLADDEAREAALSAAEASREELAATSRHERGRVLEAIAAGIEGRSAQFLELLIHEAGKTHKDAVGEIGRSISTFRFAADAARALIGKMLPLDAMAGAENKFGYTLVEPIGTVVAIPSANFPLLVSSHKIAPAIGAGCPLVMKTPDSTPRTVLLLAKIVLECGWPSAGLSVLTGDRNLGQALIKDPRPRLISFTGSSPVGKEIAATAGFKRLLLELGSNAATIVMNSADLELAANRIVAGGYSNAGQSCISVQRVYVQREVYDDLADRITTLTSALTTGSPEDKTTDVGPVISDASAERIEGVIEDALVHGARLLAGGSREGRRITPTLLADFTPDMRFHNEEIFGPVIGLAPFDTLDEALEQLNDSTFGLQAGIFTDSASEAHRVARYAAVGGVHINEVSMWRADHMPYGGVKDTGFGKEGPESAMHEMTVEKVVSWRL